ncbi:MAG: M48 family metalloprotease [Planctomycetaceae bacterium]|nr:M48 family metalloprotease [Planctomycetaceae bacterium]
MNSIVGIRQKQEADGSWRRLIFASAILAGLQALPVCVALLVTACEFTGVNQQSLFVAIPIVWIVNTVSLLEALRPPFEFIRLRRALPPVEDPAFLKRIRMIADVMKLPAPPVRIWRTAGSGLQVQAAVGGLPAPSLIVFDGMIHRLKTDERDAVIAHELAHLANHSLWFLISPTPIAGLIATLAAMFTTPVFALITGSASYLLIQRPISRYLEYDCDHRAADTLGYQTMSRSLAKLHATHFVKDHGLLSYVVYATMTHPSRVERMSALARNAPAEDRPIIDWNNREVSSRRFASRLAYLSALGLAVISLVWKCNDTSAWMPVVGMTIVATIPVSAMIIAQWLSTRRQRKRRSSNLWRPVHIAFAVMFLSSTVGRYIMPPRVEQSIARTESIRSDVWIELFAFSLLLLAMGAALLGCIFALRIVLSRRLGLSQECIHALQDHDFSKIIELAAKSPKPFMRDVNLRHNLALALALSGDRATAVEQLFQILRDEPRMHESNILLCLLAIDDGYADRALPLSEKLVSALSRDPDPLTLKATALLALRRFDEAEATVRKALEVDPEAGYAYAVRAAIEWERGNLKAAETDFQKSEEYEPGTAFLQYIRAQHTVRTGDIERARIEVKKAIAASNANPFAILQKRVQGLAEEVGLNVDDQQ